MPEKLVINMTPAGWAFMAASWAVITYLMAFCVARVLSSSKKLEPEETPLDPPA